MRAGANILSPITVNFKYPPGTVVDYAYNVFYQVNISRSFHFFCSSIDVLFKNCFLYKRVTLGTCTCFHARQPWNEALAVSLDLARINYLRCLMFLGSQDRSHSLPCPHGDRARVLQCSPGNVGSSWGSVTNTGVEERERTDREAAGRSRKTS